MPASALSWRALKPTYVTSFTDVGYIAALKQLFDASTYADGSTRTGTSTAWSTTSKDSGNSLVLTAPSNPLGLIAHFVPASLGTSLPMSFGEGRASNTAGKVYGTIVLNPGTYASNTETPWGASARCFGYCHMSPMHLPSTNPTSTELNAAGINTTNFSSIEIHAWESSDAIVIHVYTSKEICAVYVLGGWLAPDASSSDSSDAETDGVLYGIITSGNCGTRSSVLNELFYLYGQETLPATITSVGYFPFTSNSVTASSLTITSTNCVAYPHCGIFLPGSSSVTEVERQGAFRFYSVDEAQNNSYPGTLQLKTLSNKFVKMPMYFQTSTKLVGRAREMWMYKRSINGITVRSSDGQDIGYVVSFNKSDKSDSFLLGI